MRWAQDHHRLNIGEWGNVMFTDESKFNMRMSDGRRRVWRIRGEDERNARNAVLETDAFGLGGVVIWGGIWLGGRTPLVYIRNGRLNARRYIDEILQPVAIPAGVNAIGRRRLRLQHDGATAHSAVIVRNFLHDNRIVLLDWVAKMPDMNPIEHVWDMVGRKLYSSYPNLPQNINELCERMDRIWTDMAQDEIDNLIRSMPRRCEALRAANGGPTCY